MKWLLFTGLGILTLGVIFNYVIDEERWPILLIITGVGLKVIYIFFKARNTNYLPGWEILFLIFGLLLFFTGLYLSPHGNAELFSVSTVLKISGISLKIIFVVLFILKTREK